MNLCHRISLACLAAALLAVGCGGDGRPTLVQATGSVTLNDEPLEGASVGFQPQNGEIGRPSTAITDAQGKFTVGTYGRGDGIPVGTYRVTVKKIEYVGVPEDFNTEELETSEQPIPVTWVVPRMYSEPEESGLTVEVTAEGMIPDVIALEGESEVDQMGAGGDEP